jgi:hypothetical protein
MGTSFSEPHARIVDVHNSWGASIELFDLNDPEVVVPGTPGSVRLAGDPIGTPMGHVVASRGHLVLLPAKRAYRFGSDEPSVLLLQTLAGIDTVERWASICQTML